MLGFAGSTELRDGARSALYDGRRPLRGDVKRLDAVDQQPQRLLFASGPSATRRV